MQLPIGWNSLTTVKVEHQLGFCGDALLINFTHQVKTTVCSLS